MKGAQAIQRKITEDHDHISVKSSAFSEGLLLRTDLGESLLDRPRIISVPAEHDPSLEETRKGPKRAPARTFPHHEFASNLDPAVVKARYLVGPVDPTILFVGDLDERHAPDLLMHAMPAILKTHAQARLIIVGDGPLYWPLRVMSRYMLLDHAVRIVGHVGGTAVRELVAAVDVMAVPSRADTEDWQILSGWSARRPVVATPEVGRNLCAHEENSMLADASPVAFVTALNRILSDTDFARQLGEKGYRKVVEDFSGASEASSS